MGVLALAVVGAGTYSVVSTWCAVVAVLAAAALVGLAVRQLLAETRQRMQEVMAVIERDAQPRPPEWRAAEGPDAGSDPCVAGPARRFALDAPEVTEWAIVPAADPATGESAIHAGRSPSRH
jgi:hypothetical protein